MATVDLRQQCISLIGTWILLRDEISSFIASLSVSLAAGVLLSLLFLCAELWLCISGSIHESPKLLAVLYFALYIVLDSVTFVRYYYKFDIQKVGHLLAIQKRAVDFRKDFWAQDLEEQRLHVE